MRVRQITMIVVFGIAANSTVSAQVVTKQIDCGKWLQARESKSSVAFEHYIDGMIDGMSLGTGVSIRGASVPPKYSSDQVFYWMDNYCRNNPLSTIPAGVTTFSNEVTNYSYMKAQNK